MQEALRLSQEALSLYGVVDSDHWLVRLEVYTPFDEERMRDLERWRLAPDREHGEALASLLSVVDAMRETLQQRAPLEVRFPRPYRHATGTPHPA